jgi:hypothetical protein
MKLVRNRLNSMRKISRRAAGTRVTKPYQAFRFPASAAIDHVSPVRHQTVGGHAQRIDAALELPDDVFLIAAVVCEKNDFLHAPGLIVRYVEEEPDVVEQPTISLFDGEIFAQHTHTMPASLRKIAWKQPLLSLPWMQASPGLLISAVILKCYSVWEQKT